MPSGSSEIVRYPALKHIETEVNKLKNNSVFEKQNLATLNKTSNSNMNRENDIATAVEQVATSLGIIQESMYDKDDMKKLKSCFKLVGKCIAQNELTKIPNENGFSTMVTKTANFLQLAISDAVKNNNNSGKISIKTAIDELYKILTNTYKDDVANNKFTSSKIKAALVEKLKERDINNYELHRAAVLAEKYQYSPALYKLAEKIVESVHGRVDFEKNGGKFKEIQEVDTYYAKLEKDEKFKQLVGKLKETLSTRYYIEDFVNKYVKSKEIREEVVEFIKEQDTRCFDNFESQKALNEFLEKIKKNKKIWNFIATKKPMDKFYTLLAKIQELAGENPFYRASIHSSPLKVAVVHFINLTYGYDCEYYTDITINNPNFKAIWEDTYDFFTTKLVEMVKKYENYDVVLTNNHNHNTFYIDVEYDFIFATMEKILYDLSKNEGYITTKGALLKELENRVNKSVVKVRE